MIKDRLNKLDDQVKTLINRISKLEWINENPPLFKYGDTIIETEKLEDNTTFTKTLTVKDNGKVESSYLIESRYSFTRMYMVDNGQQLLQISESNLTYLKNKSYVKYENEPTDCIIPNRV